VTLLPTLRERKRYIGFEVVSNRLVPFTEVSTAIQASYLSLFGTWGLGTAGVQILKECYKNNKGIIRVNHTSVHQAKACLGAVRSIDHALVQSFTTSGNIGKVKQVG